MVHKTSHAVPLQVAIDPVGAGQAVHEAPQLSVLLFMAQAEPHLW